MELSLIGICFAIGITAGIAGGLFGVGGGTVIVPLLVLFAHFNLPKATSTSLVALLLPVGFLGVRRYYKAGLVHVKGAIAMGLGLFSGSSLGAMTAINLGSKKMEIVYSLFLLYIAWRFMEIPRLIQRIGKKSPAVTLNGSSQLDPQPLIPNAPLWGLYILGFFGGISVGLFGIGGGAIIIPALHFIFKYPYRTAAATSMASIMGPSELPAILVYMSKGEVFFPAGFLTGGGIVLGAFIGSLLGLKLPQKPVQFAYGLFLVATSIYFVLK